MEIKRLIDLIPEIKGTKNITQKNIHRVISALPKVISKLLLEGKIVKFTPFVKLGFRLAKDRMIKSSITGEMLHMPQHLRFKSTFYKEFKNYLNKGCCNEQN